MAFTIELKDENDTVIAAAGYELSMQIRATIASEDVILDCDTYATSSATHYSASVSIPAGITGAIAGHAPVDWIADAKFIKTGSDPMEATDAGRFTVKFIPEVTRS